ncbi:MAG TPA: universal stress protein [Anaeromyxobacteraceae bacterium]|nr:universal stress protein [Anaeromyxobacteraceae bacterium]
MSTPDTALFRRLLAAVDTSPRASAVLAAAREVATRFGARLHVYQAGHVPPDIPAAAPRVEDATEAGLQRRATEQLAALVGSASGAVIEPIEFDVGPPWRAILDAAERVDADLIVVGSHGFAGIDRLIGTTAAKVVNHSSRSVLVVRERPSPAPPKRRVG